MSDNKSFFGIELGVRSKEFGFTSQPPKSNEIPDILKKGFTSQPPKPKN